MMYLRTFVAPFKLIARVLRLALESLRACFFKMSRKRFLCC